MRMIDVHKRRLSLLGGELKTFIGGIGGIVNTPALLATKLDISESIIENFEVVGSDVYVNITDTYSMTSRFYNDTDITHFHDNEGKVLSLGTNQFRNCSNLISVKFPELTSLTGNSSDDSGVFRNTPSLNLCEIPKLTSMGGRNHFRDTPSLLNIELLLLTGMQTFTFTDAGVTSLNLPSVTSFQRSVFNANTSIQELIMTGLISVTIFEMFLNLRGCINIYLPNLQSINDKRNTFASSSGASAFELIDAKKLKTLGNPSHVGNSSGGEQTFNNLKTNCIINVHEDLATANSGNADAALVWAKNNRSAVVNFYDDNGDYVSTL